MRNAYPYNQDFFFTYSIFFKRVYVICHVYERGTKTPLIGNELGHQFWFKKGEL